MRLSSKYRTLAILNPILLLAGSSLFAGDASRGALVLEDQGCLQCHTIRGQDMNHEPLRIGPDLSGRLVTKYTPAALASTLWNHEPEMWKLLSSRGDLATATEEQWQDAFTYLYSLQFYDLPGEARRGSRIFDAKGCSGCHGPGAAPDYRATPVKEWASANDPVGLLYEMWNHAVSMHLQKTLAGGSPWQRLSARDLMDLTAYAQSVQKLAPNSNFSLPTPAEGRGVFEARCSRCHRGALALETRLKNTTWMEIGAALWNHASEMPSAAATSQDDMRKLLAYVWDLQYSGPAGGANSVTGARVFREKGCISCHKEANGAPRSPKPGPFTSYSMVALSWGHGRQMHSQMASQGKAWPQLSPEDMASLVSFLNVLR